ncbi:MAG: methyl-accepting chemotaxis protein [Pseudomonadota bacterium]|nr:methyl-accepting chemotaxis protein [Pseudomonadota bacterium]
MNNITIRQRVFLSFGVILAVILAMGGMALQKLGRIEAQETSMRADAIPGLYSSAQIRAEWNSYYILLQEYPMAKDAVSMANLRARMRSTRAAFDAALENYDATIHAADDRKSFEAFKTNAAALFVLQQNVMGREQAADVTTAQYMQQSVYPVFAQGRAAIAKIIDYNRANAVSGAESIHQAVVTARTGLWVSFLIALALAALTGYYLLRAVTQPLDQLTHAAARMAKGDFSKRLELVRSDEFGVLAQGYDRMGNELSALVGQIQTSGIQVNSSINEIAATLREQQATASQIASTTIEIGATSREIAATSKELSRTMGAVASGAEQTAALAGSGQSGLVQMEETMRRVIDATASINGKLAVLTEKAGNISQVVTTITKVADQTNLLSLNAAIEAEKAGEYGRGFSVVATEIRRLADQTAVATLDIEQMVREIQSAVSAGVMGMDKFAEEVRRGTHDVQQVGGQLSEVIEHVQAMVPRFEAVNEGVQAQSAGAEQITLALSQLGDAAQQTVDALRQSNQSIDELHQVSATLRDGVSKFKLQA